ncbi:hypothetical protein TNCV_1064631 [Trichonephila clavipes]|nr:hypothetical protein TNCV_1064631 [Trichonephila clavipes]
MENNICNSMILTSRRRHFYLVGQSKHKVGACGVNNQASAVLAGNELPFVAFRNRRVTIRGDAFGCKTQFILRVLSSALGGIRALRRKSESGKERERKRGVAL